MADYLTGWIGKAITQMLGLQTGGLSTFIHLYPLQQHIPATDTPADLPEIPATVKSEQ